MRSFAVAAAIALSSLWSRSSPAEELGERETDLHSQSVSPEASRGVNPGTTRGVNRGLPGVAPSVEPRAEVRSDAPGVTMTTAATWGTEASPAGADRPTETTAGRPNRTLLIAGSAIFLGSYGASAIVGTTVGTEADEKLVIPLVGPWVALGERSCTFGECGLHEDVNVLGLVASGVAQAGGVALAIASLFVPERRPARAARANVRVTPLSVGRAGAGIAAGGSF